MKQEIDQNFVMYSTGESVRMKTFPLQHIRRAFRLSFPTIMRSNYNEQLLQGDINNQRNFIRTRIESGRGIFSGSAVEPMLLVRNKPTDRKRRPLLHIASNEFERIIAGTRHHAQKWLRINCSHVHIACTYSTYIFQRRTLRTPGLARRKNDNWRNYIKFYLLTF